MGLCALTGDDDCNVDEGDKSVLNIGWPALLVCDSDDGGGGEESAYTDGFAFGMFKSAFMSKMSLMIK